jgi:GxxExxY protein
MNGMFAKEPVERDSLTEAVIGAAIEVHRNLGPGLLESVYEECLAYELRKLHPKVERQLALPIQYKDIQLEAGFRIDLRVNDRLIIELKAVDKIIALQERQLLTYMRLSGLKTGLLLNFNVYLMKDGIQRMVL